MISRTIALALLAAWLAPPVTATALGLHLAVHHSAPAHRHHGSGSHADHEARILELAETAAHGHHHGDTELADDHVHWATVQGVAGLIKIPSPAFLAAGEAADRRSAQTGIEAVSAVPPVPAGAIIYAHCSLLL